MKFIIESIEKDAAFYDGWGNPPKASHIIFEDDMHKIPDGALRNCEWVTAVTIPPHVTSIGSGAFAGCKNLTDVILPNGLNKIGSWAFSVCDNLSSINIPESVVYIADHAFFGCGALQNIIFYGENTTVGKDVFFGCDNVVIHTVRGSWMDGFAKEHGFSVKYLGE